MKHILVRYSVKKKDVERVKTAVHDFVDGVSGEPGVVLYEAFQEEEPTNFVHHIIFKDATAEKLHAQARHTQKFVDLLYPLCEKEPTFIELKKLKSTHE